MKRLTAILVFAFALSAADVPSGAIATGPGVWRYTDPRGKTWIYRRTPFGMAHFEDTPAPPPAPMPGARAFEDGDFIRFERPGPFGIYRWRTRKSELDEGEKAVWAAEQKHAPAAQAPAAQAPAAQD